MAGAPIVNAVVKEELLSEEVEEEDEEEEGPSREEDHEPPMPADAQVFIKLSCHFTHAAVLLK